MKEQCIFAGFGGQGMLLIGKFLAEAGMETGKHVSWLPSYGPEMRGGTANCSVVVSDKPVASPLIAMADTILAMNKPSLLKFEGDVKPGGLLLINSSIIDIKTSRDDVDAVYVPCKKPEVISEEAIIEAIRVELGEKKARFLEGNIKALKAGIEYVKKLG